MELNEAHTILLSPTFCNLRGIIYFLLFDKEVVYVGQSKKGLPRALSHPDIKHSSIAIYECEISELDYYEDFFIAKYQPIYNKRFNGALYKKCKKDSIYTETVTLNGNKYYKSHRTTYNLTENYFYKSILQLLNYRKKDFRFIANKMSLEKRDLLKRIAERKLKIPDLKMLADALNAELDIRFIDKDTKKPII